MRSTYLTLESFLLMPLVKSTVVADTLGRLWRVELRRDELSRRLLRGVFPVPEDLAPEGAAS